MSEQSISQRSSSDFSIARILSNDLSPNPEKKFRVEKEFNRISQSSKNNLEIINKSGEINSEADEFEKMERLQPGSRELDSERLEETKLREVEKRLDPRQSGIERTEELPWLRCTRYSPPKLPRRTGSGKQTKRRLGSHPRIPFTKLQIQVLEDKYKLSAYLSRRDVIQLAENLNLPQNRVKIWFQNRRARERRETHSHHLGLTS